MALANRLDATLTDSDEEFAQVPVPRLPPFEGISGRTVANDDEGEVAPPSFIAEVTDDWGFNLVQQDNGMWRTRRSEDEGRGPNIWYLQNQVLRRRERVIQLEQEREELEETLTEKTAQYDRLYAKYEQEKSDHETALAIRDVKYRGLVKAIDELREEAQLSTQEQQQVGTTLDRVFQGIQDLHDAQTDDLPWDGPTERSDYNAKGVRRPRNIYSQAQEKRQAKGQRTQEWDEYWARNQYLTPGRNTEDLQIQGLRGTLDAYQPVEGDHPWLAPGTRNHIDIPWFQCVAHECRYHFASKFHCDHWPIRNGLSTQPAPATWVYDHGHAPPTILWNVWKTDNGWLRIKPKNAWPRACRGVRSAASCPTADCAFHMEQKMQEHAAGRDQTAGRRRRRRRGLWGAKPEEIQWLQEHQTIDAASQGTDRDTLMYHESLGNDSGLFAEPA